MRSAHVPRYAMTAPPLSTSGFAPAIGAIDLQRMHGIQGDASCLLLGMAVGASQHETGRPKIPPIPSFPPDLNSFLLAVLLQTDQLRGGEEGLASKDDPGLESRQRPGANFKLRFP